MTLHFIRPYWLFALIPATLYVTWVIRAYRQHNPWKRVCDPHLLTALVQSGAKHSKFAFNSTLFSLFAISIIALAGPSWKKTSLPVYHEVSSLMLVLDLSNEMKTTDLKPDRLTRAKLKIRDLMNAADQMQMGLVAFTAEAFVASPLSKDANTLKALVDELDPAMMPVPGSDIGEGLSQGLTLLKQAGVSHGNLLLITASDPTAGSWSVAKEIANTGNHLNILAMLDPNPATEATIDRLKALAKTGDGSLYLFTPDTKDIQSILNSNVSKQMIKDERIDNAYLWQDGGPWLCLLLIPFALIVLREKSQHEKKI